MVCKAEYHQWYDTPYLLNIEPVGNIYNENSSGAKVEPWGTPHVTCTTEEECLPIFTENILLDRKDTFDQFKIVFYFILIEEAFSLHSLWTIWLKEVLFQACMKLGMV